MFINAQAVTDDGKTFIDFGFLRLGEKPEQTLECPGLRVTGVTFAFGFACKRGAHFSPGFLAVLLR